MFTASRSVLNTVEIASVSFESKIRCLSDPASYRESPGRVTLRETNHAWLFMTDACVYKMKKPFRLGGFDFSSLESRHRLCNEEIRLNRRLAKNTYLGVVALVFDDRGRMKLEVDGCVIEWLVKMVRLPESQSLYEAASHNRAPPDEIRKLMRKLCRFYSDTARIDFRTGQYVFHIRGELAYWSKELMRSQVALPKTRVDDLLRQQLAYVDTNSALLDKRAMDGYVRDGHGDLRPEHVFLMQDADPEIIDCLEFDPKLRRLDSAEEIAFLAMQCRHDRFEWLAQECLDSYRKEFGRAAAPSRLLNFYASLRATVRAGLAAWRIPDTPDGEEWRRRAASYLDDALYYISLALRRD